MRELEFIPEPKIVKMGSGDFRLPRHCTIAVGNRSLSDVGDAAKTLLGADEIMFGPEELGAGLTVRLAAGIKPEGYRLRIGEAGIEVEAADVPGAFHALHTLSQVMLQMPPRRVPRLVINDWPDYPVRGVYYDVTRGRVPKTGVLLEMADLLFRYKVNQLQLYLEHTFRFEGHPDIGRNASPLTADDILEMDAFCIERGIELVPSLASFGHMAQVLKHPQYHHIAEDLGVGKYVSPEVPAGKRHFPKAWSVAPGKPATYKFLDSLFAEFLPLFKSGQFNVCCDETYDLGWGQSYELCREKGKGRVYLDHILKLRELAGKYGKRIMFWGDIVRKYPELIASIPDDVTVLDWAYGHNMDFKRVHDFQDAGVSYYVCPGTGSWNAMFPRVLGAMKNIHGLAAAGLRYGACGVLNTDWGDGGHHNFMEYSWPGYLFGAEQSWNVKADAATFLRRFCRLFLKCDAAEFTNAIAELADIAQLEAHGNASFWFQVFFAKRSDALFRAESRKGFRGVRGRIEPFTVDYSAKLGRDTLKRLKKVRGVLARYRRVRGVDPTGVLPYWLFAVDTHMHAARKLSILGHGGRNTAQARASLRKEMTQLMARFKELWYARNRPSEIRITLSMYRKVLKSLQR